MLGKSWSSILVLRRWGPVGEQAAVATRSVKFTRDSSQDFMESRAISRLMCGSLLPGDDYGPSEGAGMRLLSPSTDLHRLALPAADTPGLPAHLLRRLSKGVVRFPGLDRHVDPPVHVPVMSRLGAVDAAKRLCHHAAGQLCAGQPRAGKERGREAGRPSKVQARRQCFAEAPAEGRARRGRGAHARRRAGPESARGGHTERGQQQRLGATQGAEETREES
jgi:hypothetical protein